MKLCQIMRMSKETAKEFMERSYWVAGYTNMNTGKDTSRVLVWKSAKEKNDPNAESKPEIWEIEEARRYVEQLEPGWEDQDGGSESGEDEMGNINWEEFGSFVKLEDGKPKRLLLTEWKMQDKFKEEKSEQLKKGLAFTVLMEDGKACEGNKGEAKPKEWIVTSIKAIAKLRPIIEKAEANGKDKIDVSVVKVGQGKSTEYSITEM